jgi:hypothetical protein
MAVSPAVAVSPAAAISPAVVIAVAITDEPRIYPGIRIKRIYVGDHGRVHHRDPRECDPDTDDGLCFGGGAVGDRGHTESGAKYERCKLKHGNSP